VRVFRWHLCLGVLTICPGVLEAGGGGGRGGSHSGHPSYVHGYTRSNGTYVAPHMRSAPDGNAHNNWSTRGNINPYTGEPGTRSPYASSPPSALGGGTGSNFSMPSERGFSAGGSSQFSSPHGFGYAPQPGPYSPPSGFAPPSSSGYTYGDFKTTPSPLSPAPGPTEGGMSPRRSLDYYSYPPYPVPEDRPANSVAPSASVPTTTPVASTAISDRVARSTAGRTSPMIPGSQELRSETGSDIPTKRVPFNVRVALFVLALVSYGLISWVVMSGVSRKPG